MGYLPYQPVQDFFSQQCERAVWGQANIYSLEIWHHQNRQKIRRLPGARCWCFRNVLVFIVCFHPLPAVHVFLREKNDVQSLSNGHIIITLPETSSFAVSFENLKTHPYWLKRLVSGLKVFAWDFLLSPVTSSSLSQRTGSATKNEHMPQDFNAFGTSNTSTERTQLKLIPGFHFYSIFVYCWYLISHILGECLGSGL